MVRDVYGIVLVSFSGSASPRGRDDRGPGHEIEEIHCQKKSAIDHRCGGLRVEALKLLVQEGNSSQSQPTEKVPDISVIILVCERRGDLRKLYQQYSRERSRTD